MALASKQMKYNSSRQIIQMLIIVINIPDYFSSSMNRAVYKGASQVLMSKILYEFSDVFSGIECFEGTFCLQVKDDSWLYQAPPDGMAMHSRNP